MSSRLLTMSLQSELCDHVLDVSYEHDRIVLMQITINLYRLVLALGALAPDLQRRAQQGVPEYR